jgi:hypothetical protein
MKDSEQGRRGTACHEAGHAVVMHAYHLPVQAVWVKYTEVKGGWHGDMLPGSDPEEVPLPVRCVIWTAGKMAEEHFDCRAHGRTWHLDYADMESRLDRAEIFGRARKQYIADAENKARAILRRDHDKAVRLIERLVEHDRVEREVFERLMKGDAI